MASVHPVAVEVSKKDSDIVTTLLLPSVEKLAMVTPRQSVSVTSSSHAEVGH